MTTDWLGCVTVTSAYLSFSQSKMADDSSKLKAQIAFLSSKFECITFLLTSVLFP